ncbi:Polyketide synthase isoform A [Micractinium conductrix]|uniref:Polyketide synthase isoform A n=1 Tax=Micractinium conductrix TaxID=554055 RepID=A0A2P6VKG8_9CHLO|nr:Polyketide synthase isoform A [Micractinium conductrix]|eukprot:PSC74592.1 Polyketide synthase isoform A [Micractinium conductrix]
MARPLAFAVGLADDDIARFLDSGSDSDWDEDVVQVPPLHRATTVSAPPPPITLLTATAWRGPEQTYPSGDASRLVPPSRWDVDVGWPGESALPKQFGSFVEGAELFDHVFFAVSAPEALAMDAQQRLLLEGCWEALGASAVGASSTTDAAAARAVAVGVGVSYTEYYLNAASQGMTALSATSGSLSVVCGRVSFALGLKGPSLSVDTACSSSLVVAHLAATSFLPGGCRRALAAGVNLTVRAETTAVLSKAGMLAVDGRCKTLDAAADGYMRGEACVVHLLEAATSGDRSPRGAMEAAVLLGTAVNQDGRSSSLTAPNGPSQQAVIRAALERAGVPALDIGTLEMHGTGTALGDPIEVGAAFLVLQATGRAPLELHAAKSRLLHAEPAAGAVGLAQLVLRLGQMGRHHILHLHAINPHVASAQVLVMSCQLSAPALAYLADHQRAAGVALHSCAFIGGGWWSLLPCDDCGSRTCPADRLATSSRLALRAGDIPGVDMYGHTLQGLVWNMPRLVVRKPDASLAARGVSTAAAKHLDGAVIITGGLGALGALASAWLCGTSSQSDLWLLGRSGRASGETLAQLVHSVRQVTCAKADNLQARYMAPSTCCQDA